MAIIKRSTPEERAKKELGPTYRRALTHPYLKSMKRIGYDVSPVSVIKALAAVRGWKGAAYEDKVFVYILASVLWRAFGQELMTDANFDKLRKHLEEHASDVLAKCHLNYHQIMVWDEPNLRKFGKNELELAAPKPVRKLKRKVPAKLKKRLRLKKKS